MLYRRVKLYGVTRNRVKRIRVTRRPPVSHTNFYLLIRFSSHQFFYHYCTLNLYWKRLFFSKYMQISETWKEHTSSRYLWHSRIVCISWCIVFIFNLFSFSSYTCVGHSFRHSLDITMEWNQCTLFTYLPCGGLSVSVDRIYYVSPLHESQYWNICLQIITYHWFVGYLGDSNCW